MKKSFLNTITSLPFFSAVSSAYLKREPAIKLLLTKSSGAGVSAKYPGLTVSFGCEGDYDAPISFIDGSFLLRDRGRVLIGFGTKKLDSKVNWFNKEGWLPCIVCEYVSGGFNITIENFADKLSFNGNIFEAVYSRMTVTNPSENPQRLPRVSKMLTELNDGAHKSIIGAGETLVRDYAVLADRFGGEYPYPDGAVLRSEGGFDEHYEKMRAYWQQRIEPLAMPELPDETLVNAYKAGYVYTMIVKDGDELHVGENGYDRVFDHDVIGILSMLLAMGDTCDFAAYAKTILKNLQYPDARWKYSWVFSQYLFKTSDEETVRGFFTSIKENAHCIGSDRENGSIMQESCAIDSDGHWLLDNQSALTGLAAYKYICRRIGEKEEFAWADAEYDSLLDAVNERLDKTMKKFSLDYLPISLDEPNETGARSDVRDANWASMFLFGRWSWEAYLMGERQDGAMLGCIDKTYEHGFERRRETEKAKENFGGFPHGYFCSAYNAGYGAAALRGERFRDIGIKAYQYMINNAQSGPFSWWEGIGYPDANSPWSQPHAACGGGSCQHIWGQATASKTLLDSIICEKYDGTAVIGRGVPDEWLEPGKRLGIKNYLLSGGKAGFLIVCGENEISITLDKSKAQYKAQIDLPLLIKKNFSCEGGEAMPNGSVLVPEGTEKVVIKF